VANWLAIEIQIVETLLANG